MNIADWQVKSAEQFHDQVALIAGSVSYTNGQLLAETQNLARALREIGAQPGDRIAVCLDNTPELYVAVSAVYFAGMVLVILPRTADLEIVRMLNECEAVALIGQSQQLLAVLDQLPDLLAISSGLQHAEGGLLSLAELIRTGPPQEHPTERTPSDTAQLSYTSGTTGVARPAIFTHGALDAFLNRSAPPPSILKPPTKVLLAVPPTAFSGRMVMMRAVANYCYILLARFDPAAACAAIERHKVEMMPMLPTMAEQIIATVSDRRHDCSSLRVANLSGARVSNTLIQQLIAGFGRSRPTGSPEGAPLRVNIHYGMTEAGGGIASTEGTAIVAEHSVGRVLGHVEARIADEKQLEGIGRSIGEIEVRTPYAATGYWNDPVGSALVFRQGWVRTGDLGFFTYDGELCVVGRQREIINQGGFKILPQELVAHIERVPGVGSCAVVGVENALLGEEAVACVVRSAGATVSATDVLDQCEHLLDSRKRPGQVLFFDSLPRTPVGKYDLAALKEQVVGRRAAHRDDRRRMVDGMARERRHAFVSDTVLAAIRELVPVESGGMGSVVDDSTFGDLGLDSISAVRLSHMLSERLGHQFGATLIYTYPTVAELCSFAQSVL